MHWLWAVFSHLQFVCADLSYVIRFVSSTKSNIIVQFSKHSNVVSNSDMKNRKRIEKRKELCENPVLVSIQSLLNSENAIFVCLSVRKHLITWVIHDEKPAFCMMCRSLSWKTLSNASFRFRLSMKTIHSDCVFHAVLTHVVSSLRTERVNHCFLTLIWFHERRLCTSAAHAAYSAISFFINFTIVFLSAMRQ